MNGCIFSLDLFVPEMSWPFHLKMHESDNVAGMKSSVRRLRSDRRKHGSRMMESKKLSLGMILSFSRDLCCSVKI